MKHRIITHGNCTDGFCSAFIFKRYFSKLLGYEPNSEEMKNLEVVSAMPRDIQSDLIEIKEGDIVLDLPLPKHKVFFWCDHHLSAKPDNLDSLPKNHYWREDPSNSGLLINIAEEQGLKISNNLQIFKLAIDKMDSADYSVEEIKKVYYRQENYNDPSMLQRVHFLGNIYRTRDRYLNDILFNSLLCTELGETPVDIEMFKNLQPLLFNEAQMRGFEDWRTHIDTYVYLDESVKCVIQDNRKVEYSKGVVDRFYVYLKFPEASYGINIKVLKDEENIARMGVGCNIFHKDRCKIDIGKLCKNVAVKFGEGSGGGHRTVGGITLFADKIDEAIKHVLKEMKEAE